MCEAFAYLRPQAKSPAHLKALQEATFFGKEKKSLAYVIGIMNMILHGVEAPAITHTNTLAEPLQSDERYDIILANPPFGGKERKEVQYNFPIKTGETAFLFLQHFIKRLKPGGRAAIVIKNTFLSNGDTGARALRRELLTTCNLRAVLDCPQGTFQGAGVKTVVLFFEKGRPTREIWYYQLDPGRSLGKTNALTDDDFAEFVAQFPDRPTTECAWRVQVEGVDAQTWDLSVKTPHAPQEQTTRSPAAIVAAIAALDDEGAQILAEIRGMVA